jgi:hypothetical protein
VGERDCTRWGRPPGRRIWVAEGRQRGWPMRGEGGGGSPGTARATTPSRRRSPPSSRRCASPAPQACSGEAAEEGREGGGGSGHVREVLRLGSRRPASEQLDREEREGGAAGCVGGRGTRERVLCACAESVRFLCLMAREGRPSPPRRTSLQRRRRAGGPPDAPMPLRLGPSAVASSRSPRLAADRERTGEG